MVVLKSVSTILGNQIKLISNYEKVEKNPVLIVGVFHGEEPQGKFLIENYLRSNTKSKNIFIPCLNPDGMSKNERTNANGVDLNRNYPTKNWVLTEKDEFYGGSSPASEIETRFMISVLQEYKPKLILALHAPFKVVNYDGPARSISQDISDIIGYPVEESIGYPTPGSFGTYCGVERNIPTITLELDEVCPVEDLINPVNKIFDMLSYL